MSHEFHKRYYISKKLAKDLTKLTSAMYDPEDPAREINNPKPLFEALGIRKPLSMQEKLERLFRGPRGLIEQMYEQGEERPDEMFDFGEEDDDIEPISPYEATVMVEERLKEDAPPAKPRVKEKPATKEPQPDEDERS
jgi:hypothetical protein